MAIAKHLHTEKEYQTKWCKDVGGIMEYRLDDNTRVDCLTDEYAIEFDFDLKWAESTGQSLYYAYKTKKKPGVVLIMESKNSDVYLRRLMTISDCLGITVWTMTEEDLKKDF